MDFLNNKENDLDNSSSDYSDGEMEYIDYDSIEFNKPIKNKDNIYIANLDEKIILELDNLDVFEYIEEGSNKYVIFNLDLDNDDHNELIEILYNLDEKALEKCFEYSQEWFNKEMNEDDIEKLYVPLYIDNYKQKGHVLIKVLLDTNINIDTLHISNINIIEIKGLIFYKKTFLYHIILKDILKENINLIDDINSIDNINTDKQLEKKELLEKKRLEVKQAFIESENLNKDAEEKRIRAIESANELRKIEDEFKNA